MPNSTSEPLRFPPIPGFTVRVDFEGDALSSDFGPLLRRGVDQQIGLAYRWAQALEDKRHPSYLDPSLRDLLAPRIYQVAYGQEEGNDADCLRIDPLFKLGRERAPLDPTTDLASAATCFRLEKVATRKNSYRLAQAFVEQFIASYTTARIGAALGMQVEDVYTQHRRLWVRLREKGGKRHEMPCHHNLEDYLAAYLDGADLRDDANLPATLPPPPLLT